MMGEDVYLFGLSAVVVIIILCFCIYEEFLSTSVIHLVSESFTVVKPFRHLTVELKIHQQS